MITKFDNLVPLNGIGFKLSEQTKNDLKVTILKNNSKTIIDKFMIPIHDIKSNEIGQMIYGLNKSPTMNFMRYKLSKGSKKKHLYNLDNAVKEVTCKPLLIVSEIIDAVKFYQLGHRNVIALMGKTMSFHQEELIRQHADSHMRIILYLLKKKRQKLKHDKIALRLSKFSYVKVYETQEPFEITAKIVENLF